MSVLRRIASIYWLCCCCLALSADGNAQGANEVLYNGIVLPQGWLGARAPRQQYEVPTYIVNPPAVIPIDIGRQLFVDDFLVEETTLTRTQHRPAMFAGNPVLRPFEFPDLNPWAFPYSDGVWFDPADQRFKMWYLGGTGAQISYAYSLDGKQWVRPALPGVFPPGTNRVLDLGGGRDSNTIWMDLEDQDSSRKFKAFPYAAGSRVSLFFSPDGLAWKRQPQQIQTFDDRTTFFWNPFRKVWVNNIRATASMPAAGWLPKQSVRARYYAESKDLLNWTPSNPLTTFWAAADEQDQPYAGPGGQPPQLYSLDAVAYESVMLGLFGFLHAGPEETPGFLPAPNLVELSAGFSRDGFQWVRPTRGSAGFHPGEQFTGRLGRVQHAVGWWLRPGRRRRTMVLFQRTTRRTLQTLVDDAFGCRSCPAPPRRLLLDGRGPCRRSAYDARRPVYRQPPLCQHRRPGRRASGRSARSAEQPHRAVLEVEFRARVRQSRPARGHVERRFQSCLSGRTAGPIPVLPDERLALFVLGDFGPERRQPWLCRRRRTGLHRPHRHGRNGESCVGVRCHGPGSCHRCSRRE